MAESLTRPSAAGPRMGGTDLLMLMTVLIWAGNVSVVKIGTADHVPPRLQRRPAQPGRAGLPHRPGPEPGEVQAGTQG
ncbi:MAG: hypothetical protein MZW92_62010 [Comamonadaceae bacterium]|nr:hypothetical protein [Comamonadaceae bacterium]